MQLIFKLFSDNLSNACSSGWRRKAARQLQDQAAYVPCLPLSDQSYTIERDIYAFIKTNETTLTFKYHEHPITLVDTRCNDITKTPMNEHDVSLCIVCFLPIMHGMMFYKCTSEDQGCDFVAHDWCTQLPAD